MIMRCFSLADIAWWLAVGISITVNTGYGFGETNVAYASKPHLDSTIILLTLWIEFLRNDEGRTDRRNG